MLASCSAFITHIAPPNTHICTRAQHINTHYIHPASPPFRPLNPPHSTTCFRMCMLVTHTHTHFAHRIFGQHITSIFARAFFAYCRNETSARALSRARSGLFFPTDFRDLRRNNTLETHYICGHICNYFGQRFITRGWVTNKYRKHLFFPLKEY